jgi:hypothetical protein
MSAKNPIEYYRQKYKNGCSDIAIDILAMDLVLGNKQLTTSKRGHGKSDYQKIHDAIVAYRALPLNEFKKRTDMKSRIRGIYKNRWEHLRGIK